MQYRSLLAAAVVLAGCQSPDGAVTAPTTPVNHVDAPALKTSLHHHGPAVQPNGPLPFDQLLQVKAATARYRDIENAKQDGYVDLLFIPHMGEHFIRNDLKDGKFELTKPEILVYSPHENGRMELVAVEYAVPLDQSVEAPEGFRGNADAWTRSEEFGLWLLHAWVWKENPDGVFNPTNSRVP